MSRSIIALAVLSLTGPPVWAQAFVQLPTVQTNSVRTTVSVPDGGSALLGGVSAARDSQQNAGFLPFGSAVGRDVRRSSLRAEASIHDFEYFDRVVLGIDTGRQDSVYVWRNPVAKYSWERLHGRDRSLVQTVLDGARVTQGEDYDAQTAPAPREEPASPPPARNRDIAEISEPAPARVSVSMTPPRDGNTPIGRLLNLGDRAMSRNRPGSAVGFYRGAARLGSQEAEENIREILDQLKP